MSTTEERPATSNRRRRTSESDEEKTKREYPANIPLPDEQLGQTLEGVVITVVKRGRVAFGFVTPGAELPKTGEASTRIYFSPAFINNGTKVLLRRGYEVEFTVSLDEKGRQVAKISKLTEQGVATMTAREAAIAQKRAENPREPAPAQERKEAPKKTEKKKADKEKVEKEAATPESEEADKEKKSDKKLKKRKPRPERKVTLKLKKMDSAEEEKTVEVNLNLPLSKLKIKAVEALGADREAISLYSADGEFLLNKTYRKLKDDDVVLVGPKKEKVEVEAA